MPYEVLEIILIDFFNMSSLNKIHVKWHNETNLFVNINNKNENDWKKPLTSIQNYNVHMFWPKMIQHQEYKTENPWKRKWSKEANSHFMFALISSM